MLIQLLQVCNLQKLQLTFWKHKDSWWSEDVKETTDFSGTIDVVTFVYWSVFRPLRVTASEAWFQIKSHVFWLFGLWTLQHAAEELQRLLSAGWHHCCCRSVVHASTITQRNQFHFLFIIISLFSFMSNWKHLMILHCLTCVFEKSAL